MKDLFIDPFLTHKKCQVIDRENNDISTSIKLLIIRRYKEIGCEFVELCCKESDFEEA